MHAIKTDPIYYPFKKFNPQPLCNTHHNPIHPVEIIEGGGLQVVYASISLLYAINFLK